MALRRIKAELIKILPKSLVLLCRTLRHPEDLVAVATFLLKPNRKVSFRQRLFMVKRLYVISYAVDCPHTQHEIIPFIKAVFSINGDVQGCLVEAGCYKGGSTAKFSLAAKMCSRQLVAFDSFEGIPEHNEPHDKNIFGKPAFFPKGIFCGTLEEVRNNVRRYGEIRACELVKGWFEDTMPKFSRPIVAIYLDVDLACSTRTCLKYLYPLLVPEGVLYSQDGHLPLVIGVFDDDKFWKNEVGCEKPAIKGLRTKKLISIVKPKDHAQKQVGL